MEICESEIVKWIFLVIGIKMHEGIVYNIIIDTVLLSISWFNEEPSLIAYHVKN